MAVDRTEPPGPPLLGSPKPPYNLEAEYSLIGSMLVNNAHFHACRGIVRADDFYDQANQRLFAAIERAVDAGELADHRTLFHLFETDPALAELDGAKTLERLAHAADTIITAVPYAKIIRDLALKRRLAAISDDLGHTARSGATSVEAFARAREALDAIGREIGQASRIRPLSPWEWPKPQRPKVIDGILGQDFTSIVFGASSVGKSFFAIDMAMRIAMGMRWRGRPVQQGGVIYIAAEASTSIMRRMQAWMLRNGGDEGWFSSPPIAIIPGPIDLLGPRSDPSNSDLQAVIEACKAATDRWQHEPRLIITDTLASAAPGTKEDTEDTGRFVRVQRLIQEAMKAATLTVHHSGKDSSKGERGGSGLRAAADLSIEIVDEISDRDARQPVIRKVRDGDEGAEIWPYLIQTVDLAKDEDGRIITAGVHHVVEPLPPEQQDITITDHRRAAAQKMAKEGMTQREIAAKLGVSRNAVVKYLKAGE